MLVFGSVARGDQHADSDIDLVAIFDDLDYQQRFYAKSDVRERAEQAAGCKVDVHATDWPEWVMRTQNVSSSFEAHIASEAVVLWDREPKDVHWDKPMCKAVSNHEEALQFLTGWNSHHMYRLMAELRLPDDADDAEIVARWDDPQWAGYRLRGFCKSAALALRGALCALACFRGVRYPPLPKLDWDFAGFAAAQPPEVRSERGEWIDDVAKIDVSGHETVCDERWCCFPLVPDAELIPIARTLAGSAAHFVAYVCEQMHPAMQGTDGNAANDCRCDLHPLEKYAAEVLALLEQWNPPSPTPPRPQLRSSVQARRARAAR